MKYLVFIPLVFVASCASPPRPVVRLVPTPAVEPVEAVRYGEVIRTYHVGRYADPNNPEMMQEEHQVYRVEVSGRWNLHPGSPATPLLNPPPDVAFAPPATNDAVVAELNRQRETTALVMQQAVRLAKSYGELQNIFAEMKNVARDNAVLGARLASTEQRVAGVEKELQKITAPPAPSTNDVTGILPESTKP